MSTVSSWYPTHDFPRHWTPQDLADAVPLRLFEVVEFAGNLAAASNSATTPAARDWRHRGDVRTAKYLRAAGFPPRFRVR